MFAGTCGTAWQCCFLAAAFLALAGCNSESDAERKIGRNAHIDASGGQTSACGVVVAGTIGRGAPVAADDPITFSTTWVRDDRYDGMEDNDLRGFLDGAFKEGWNQVSQTHLRLGRRSRNPSFGEYELFRNLQRWDGLALPTNAQVVDAEISLSLESGPPFPVDVAIYAVRKDWNPGAGGVNRDNNSPPAAGEVWWRDARYGTTPWASAGVGYASDTDELADTFAQPLALAHYEPGQQNLLFQSTALARYVEGRVRQSQPLLLLYKLTDPYEDSIGSVFEVWSANVGVAGSDRRPRLTLRWQAPQGTTALKKRLTLEPGRSVELDNIEAAAGEILAASFIHVEEQGPDACGQRAFLEFRTANSDWQALDRPVQLASDVFDLRITAATRPTALGSMIELRLRDTWIPVGAADDHVVHWSVRGPDGLVRDIESAHAGDYTWQLHVPANVPGRWSIRWRHELSGSASESEWHTIDVVARELGQVRDSLKQLVNDIEASGAAPRSHAMLPFEMAFMRLERAAAEQLARSSTEAGDKAEIPLFINKLRELLSGRDVPEEFVPEPIKSREAPTGK